MTPAIPVASESLPSTTSWAFPATAEAVRAAVAVSSRDVIIRADFSPSLDAAPLPAGFEDIADVVAEAERDPARRVALEAGRRIVAERHYAGATSLAALRLRRGWSQRMLADKSGLQQPHIARLESGRNDPSLATMRRLAQALGVTLGEMVEALDAQERPAP